MIDQAAAFSRAINAHIQAAAGTRREARARPSAGGPPRVPAHVPAARARRALALEPPCSRLRSACAGGQPARPRALVRAPCSRQLPRREPYREHADGRHQRRDEQRDPRPAVGAAETHVRRHRGEARPPRARAGGEVFDAHPAFERHAFARGRRGPPPCGAARADRRFLPGRATAPRMSTGSLLGPIAKQSFTWSSRDPAARRGR